MENRLVIAWVRMQGEKTRGVSSRERVVMVQLSVLTVVVVT